MDAGIFKGIGIWIGRISRRLAGKKQNTRSPSSYVGPGATCATGPAVYDSKVPLVCIGYLPLDVEKKIKLNQVMRGCGISKEMREQALKQVETFRNN